MKEYFTGQYLRGYISRIKYFVLIAVIIFAISIACGNIFNELFKPLAMKIIKNMIQSAPAKETGMSFFINNIKVMILLCLGGITFSIPSLIVLFVNGLLIGYVSALVPTNSFLLLILPHGIFELSAVVLSCSAGLMLTYVIVKLITGIISSFVTVHEEWIESKIIIKDIIVTMIIVIILTLIAGFIEAYITVPLATYIMSL